MNHLWQSTVFALAAGLLTLAFRGNRAQVRYWIWFGASVKFLVPFAMLMSVGKLVPTRSARPVASAAVAVAAEEIAAPFEDTVVAVPLQRHSIDWLPIAWACGFAAMVLVRFRGWLRIRAAVRASVPMDLALGVAVRTSPGLLEPGVAGMWRPVLLLPADIIERLTASQLVAMLAHELCHVRRRDNLLAAVHILVEALFWFHPLVWWIGARLVDERERACDEEVLRQGNAPHEYAEAILNVCKLYVESPLACVPGVTGSDLKKRIEAILRNRAARELTLTRKAALASAAMAVLAIPIAVGILTAPVTRAQQSGERPKFEVASVKPCAPGDSGGRGLTGGRAISPGRLHLPCLTAADLIRMAYMPGPAVPLEGGPKWIESERFDIDAKAEEDTGRAVLRGAMLQTLLEGRFRLKIHIESRLSTVYTMSVAKGGAKLRPAAEGGCMSVPPGTLVTRDTAQTPKLCGIYFARKKDAPGTLTLNSRGTSLDTLCENLGRLLDRPVVNQMGIAGVFDFEVEFAPDASTPAFFGGGSMARFAALPENAASDPQGPSLIAALQQQLGLKIEPAKGSRDYLVIDRVERPSEN